MHEWGVCVSFHHINLWFGRKTSTALMFFIKYFCQTYFAQVHTWTHRWAHDRCIVKCTYTHKYKSIDIRKYVVTLPSSHLSTHAYSIETYLLMQIVKLVDCRYIYADVFLICKSHSHAQYHLHREIFIFIQLIHARTACIRFFRTHSSFI